VGHVGSGSLARHDHATLTSPSGASGRARQSLPRRRARFMSRVRGAARQGAARLDRHRLGAFRQVIWPHLSSDHPGSHGEVLGRSLDPDHWPASAARTRERTSSCDPPPGSQASAQILSLRVRDRSGLSSWRACSWHRATSTRPDTCMRRQEQRIDGCGVSEQPVGSGGVVSTPMMVIYESPRYPRRPSPGKQQPPSQRRVVPDKGDSCATRDHAR
jgi:hypothetical protein